jgi:beta-ribofuranosylaminobenzene 5'-phosphate synthase
MQENGLRINGGIGFAAQSPYVNVSAEDSSSFEVKDERGHGFDAKSEKRLLASLGALKEKYEFAQAVSITISGNAYSHYGFGTGTAIRLACLEALMLVNDHPVSKGELIRLSGRGGTSGIGIHTYFHGGLVLDLGRKNDGKAHIPSSQAKGKLSTPLLLQQVAMPEWEIGICIPSHIKALTEKEEKTFFAKTCPIPEAEAHKAMYHAVAGVYAAVQEHDKTVFEASIKALQECAWKKAERQMHGEPLSELESQLYEMGATAVGMSSLGPSLFFLADDMDAVIGKMQDVIPNCEFIKTKPANSGRVINYA